MARATGELAEYMAKSRDRQAGCAVFTESERVQLKSGHPAQWLEGLQSYTDRKSTRLNSSHTVISYAVFCLKKKKTRLNSSHTLISNAPFCLSKKCASLSRSLTGDALTVVR